MNRKKVIYKNCIATVVALILGLSLSACSLDDLNGNKLRQSYYDALGDMTVGKAVVVESQSSDRYAYQQLDDETKTVYDQMYETIINHTEAVTVSTMDMDVIDRAYKGIFADYGNIFWISGYQVNTYYSGDTPIRLEICPKYTFTPEDTAELSTQIERVMDEWLAGLDEITPVDGEEITDYDKAEYVFTKLIDTVEYDVDSENNQNVISVFLNKKTVCQGYADAIWCMLDRLGIECTIVTGTANGEPHAWNLVYLDGAYYYMDATWGNSRYLNVDDGVTKRVNYAYMAMTSEEMSATHSLDVPFNMPECVSNGDNYFIKHNRYFDIWNSAPIGNAIGESYDSGEQYCSLKFANSNLYNQTKEYFIDEHHIKDWCYGIDKVTYLEETDVNVLTFKWKNDEL